MTDQDTNNNILPLRENLVKTAVQFLQNPKVSSSPLTQKQEFLKRKGLTDEEIKTAFKLASVDIADMNIADRNTLQNQNPYTAVQIPSGSIYPYRQMNVYQPTFLWKIKEFFNATALIGVTLYCAYWFYKKFIEPFLFGRKKKSCIGDKVTELDKTVQNSMKEVKDSILKVEGEVQKLTQHQALDPTIPQLVQELKHDLSSLKALLLSRKQFPTAPASIPPWQLSATNVSQEKVTEREDDAGSGSSTNNSDSSLEMIREDPSKE
ncbi:Peroxisomal membrane protein PEX14 [Trachymyrmex zeteki]|uniref:Peroxisomal membrane protein PEX14 n=1 Tax=Mycetomoellerius zeteki TaxID=64791 RepID=A0A151X9W5_9HYME|nr:PREDICTED: peroxisomal membrane protein PEX14 [Trachymyrmex zeteki]KYQ57119.1 Peroxisomal membrane protein PEX14 [Trachymyrmex zeteki]